MLGVRRGQRVEGCGLALEELMLCLWLHSYGHGSHSWKPAVHGIQGYKCTGLRGTWLVTGLRLAGSDGQLWNLGIYSLAKFRPTNMLGRIQ